MKRQMIIMQSAQSDAPGEGRDMAGGSGYADFPEVSYGTATSPPPNGTAMTSQTSSSGGDSPDKPLLPAAASSPYTDVSVEGNVVTPSVEAPLGASSERWEEEEIPTGVAAPYLVSTTKFAFFTPNLCSKFLNHAQPWFESHTGTISPSPSPNFSTPRSQLHGVPWVLASDYNFHPTIIGVLGLIS